MNSIFIGHTGESDNPTRKVLGIGKPCRVHAHTLAPTRTRTGAHTPHMLVDVARRKETHRQGRTKVEGTRQRSSSKLLLRHTRARVCTRTCTNALCKVIDTWRNPYLYIIQCAGDPSVCAAGERLGAALLYAIKSLCAAFSSLNNSSSDWLRHRRLPGQVEALPNPNCTGLIFLFLPFLSCTSNFFFSYCTQEEIHLLPQAGI